MSDRVLWTTDASGVVDVRLNRPDKLNALDTDMFEALVAASEAIKANSDARVVIISGVGKGFCAGLDRHLFLASAGDKDARSKVARIVDPGDRITHLAQQAAWGWREIAIPVIAAIHGVCLGGGLQIAMACDVRIASPDSRLAVREIEWGLTPDMTGTVTLPALVSHDIAKELAMTGRMVSGEEANRLGVVTRVAADPRTEAAELAVKISLRNPDAIRALKRLFDPAQSDLPLRERFADERDTIINIGRSPNTAEAALASFEGRAPHFVGPL
jgi:enoyl-CoA hydratase/carnithine racemase